MPGLHHHRRTRTGLLLIALLIVLLPVTGTVSAAEYWVIDIIDRSSSGQPAQGSSSPQMSADARYVVFATATALTPDDTDTLADVYLRDRQTDGLVRISPDSYQNQPITQVYPPYISSDGGYILFAAMIRYVTPSGYFSTRLQLFRVERTSGNILSFVGSPTGSGYDFSTDGACTAFASSSRLAPEDTDNYTDIYLYMWASQTLTRVSKPGTGTQVNGSSGSPLVSSCDRVVFRSTASNLVPGDTNNASDVFVFDAGSGQTRRVNVGVNGEQATAGDSGSVVLSGSGRYVVFRTPANNLVAGDPCCADLILRDLDSGQNRLIARRPDGTQVGSALDVDAISYDGRYVAFTAYNLPLSPVFTATYVQNTETNTFISQFATSSGAQPATNAPNDDSSPRVAFPTGAESDTIVFVDRDIYTPGDTGVTFNIFVARIRIVPPPAPTGLRVVGTTVTSVALAWNDMSRDETHFVVERSVDSGTTWTQVGQLPADSRAFTDTTAQCGRSYRYRVRARRADENTFSAYSNVVTAATTSCTVEDPPAAVPRRNLYVISTPTLSWNRVSWAAGYQVQVARNAAFTLGLTTITVNNPAARQVTSGSLADGLYYWRVRARRANGTWGTWSTPDLFTVNTP